MTKGGRPATEPNEKREGRNRAHARSADHVRTEDGQHDETHQQDNGGVQMRRRAGEVDEADPRLPLFGGLS
jgi:hypothetical protein